MLRAVSSAYVGDECRCSASAKSVGNWIWAGSWVVRSERVIDHRHPQVAHILTRDFRRGRDKAHRLALAAFKQGCHIHSFAVGGCNLQSVSAPARAADVDGDARLVLGRFRSARIELKRKTVHLHDAVDVLHVRRGASLSHGTPA